MSCYVLLFLLDIKVENIQKYLLNARLAGDYLYGKLLFARLGVAGDVFDGVLFCAVLFSHEISWMRYWSQLLRIFLPTFFFNKTCTSFHLFTCFFFCFFFVSEGNLIKR